MEREAKDIDAFKKLYVERFEAIAGFCRQYVKDKETASDLAQETFFKLYERFDASYSRENMLAFLYITAKNLCLDCLARERFKREDIDELKDDLLSEDFFLDEITREEMIATVREAVGKLSGRSREIAELSLQNKTNPEIAEALGISVNSVKSLKKEMCSKLRDMLEDEYLVLLVAHFLEKKIAGMTHPLCPLARIYDVRRALWNKRQRNE